MKLTLSMVKPRRWHGTLIPVLHSPFLIGREPGCHLRADTASVNPLHCALTVRADKVFVSDLSGKQETFINDHEVQGELEVHDRDLLRVGRLIFAIQVTDEVEQPAAVAAASAEDEAADLLLATEPRGDDGSFLGFPAVSAPPEDTLPETADPKTVIQRPAPPTTLDTARAAQELLARYRKPHGR